MQKQKMSLANIKGKLSRAEIKNIMAGLVLTGTCGVKVDGTWYYNFGTRAVCEGAVGNTVIYNGAPIGTATNWCCDSC
jgi:hypothetical protein